METIESADTGTSVLLTKEYGRRKFQPQDTVWYLRKRYLVAFLGFWGMTCLLLMRSNFSMAMVEFTSSKEVVLDNKTFYKEPEFKWNSRDKGYVLSSFFYGYFFFSPVGGILSTKFGGATTLGFGVFFTAIFTVFSPFFLRLNYFVFIAVRVLEGVFEAFAFVSYTELFIYWAPPDERSRLVMLAFMGTEMGVAVNYPLSGFVTRHFGWEWIFYTTAGISLVWCLIWFILVTDTPSKDKFMTYAEGSYLAFSIDATPKDKIAYPWKDILTSKALWAFVNEFFVKAWSYSLINSSLPLYIDDVHDVNIETIGIISGIPPFCAFLAECIAPILADYLRNKSSFSISYVHKLFIGIGQLSAAFLLITVGMGTSFVGSIICFSLIKIGFSFAETSYEVLPIDTFARYASLVRGMCTSAFSLGSFLSPIVMGYMITDHAYSEWKQYFIFLSLFNIWGALVFLKFGSGAVQSWARELEYENESRCNDSIEMKRDKNFL